MRTAGDHGVYVRAAWRIKPGSLKDISFAVPHMDVLPIFNDFLGAVAPNLEGLHLNMLPMATDPCATSRKSSHPPSQILVVSLTAEAPCR